MEFWIIPIIILFTLFILKFPVAYAMLISTLAYYMANTSAMPSEIIVQRMVASMESFSYLAIPFFCCAGVVFNYSGITRRLIDLAEVLVGHLQGGLAHANIVLATLMGGLSGSANADAAMQAKMLVPEMERLGYSKAFSTCVTTAASVITPIIPPGIILILYATASNVSIAKMFYAGYIPGLILMAALMLVVSVIAKKRNYPRSREKRASLRELGSKIIKAIWALFLPFGLVLGLRVGFFTPTEAGAMCVVYALFVGKFVYKELQWSDLRAILMESATATAGIMFIISAAMAFGSFLTWERIPITVANVMTANITDPVVMLIVINVMLLIIGCFFEGGAAMVLLAPILVPVVDAMGIDLLFFGIIMSVNLVISGFTPPFGTMMFVTTSITGLTIDKYIRECWPFLLVLILVVFLLTFMPSVILFLPNLLS